MIDEIKNLKYTPKKTILFVTPCLSFAGAEKILCWLAENLSNDGYEIHILDLEISDNNSTFKRQIKSEIKIHLLKKKKRCFFNQILTTIMLAKKYDVDCIVGFVRRICITVVLAGILARKKTIISERGDPKQHAKGVINKIGFLIMSQSAGCVFQTEYAKFGYSEKLINKSIVVPNPIKVNFSEIKKPKSFTIAYLGRIDNKQKRIDVLVNGFYKFSKNNPNYTLNIYGKGPDEENVERLINDLKMDTKITLNGLSTNPIQDISKNEIFVLTSDFEGIPNSLLEAMAIGKPIITTDFSPGSARALIKDHFNGLIIETGDADALSIALSEYANNKGLKETCGENAKYVVKAFEPRKIYKIWKTYFDSIC